MIKITLAGLWTTGTGTPGRCGPRRRCAHGRHARSACAAPYRAVLRDEPRQVTWHARPRHSDTHDVYVLRRSRAQQVRSQRGAGLTTPCLSALVVGNQWSGTRRPRSASLRLPSIPLSALRINLAPDAHSSEQRNLYPVPLLPLTNYPLRCVVFPDGKPAAPAAPAAPTQPSGYVHAGRPAGCAAAVHRVHFDPNSY